MTAAKMENKDLDQPDALQEAFMKVMAYVGKNRRKFLMVIGALTLIMILGAGYIFYSAHKESEASRLYFETKLKIMKSDPVGSDPGGSEAIQALEGIVEKYPSSDAAQSARYELGNLYFTIGDFDRSILIYHSFIDKADRKDVRTVYVWFGIGYAHEGKKEYERALEAFNRVVDSKPGNVHEGIGYRNIARIHEELNDHGKALDYYRKALEKTKDPAATTLIRRKIAQLG